MSNALGKVMHFCRDETMEWHHDIFLDEAEQAGHESSILSVNYCITEQDVKSTSGEL